LIEIEYAPARSDADEASVQKIRYFLAVNPKETQIQPTFVTQCEPDTTPTTAITTTTTTRPTRRRRRSTTATTTTATRQKPQLHQQLQPIKLHLKNMSLETPN